MARAGFALLLFSLLPAFALSSGFEGGHLKLQGVGTQYPDDSIFKTLLGNSSQDESGELRLKFRAGKEAWSVTADYQLFARYGDSLALNDNPGFTFFLPQNAPSDELRWWDLTHEIDSSNNSVIVQRLDRLRLDYTGDKTVLRFGRQAVSWGNGLIFNPMDVFNPFDPTAVDTEYKIGDDMLYGQYLTDAGNDWQFVQVVRRDENGNLGQEVNSTALKFHGFSSEREYDLLLAEHYDELLLGLGGSSSWGGAVVRADVTVTKTRGDWEASLVANWSYSWVWGGKNVSAVAEYYFNGYGLRESDYSIDKIQASQGLIDRITRGELFTIGRHYMAGSILLEVTPLLTITPNIFVNLGDGSVLAQLVAQWSVAQNWQLLGSINAPMGPSGTEYGGLELAVESVTLAVGPSIFAQLAWYF